MPLLPDPPAHVFAPHVKEDQRDPELTYRERALRDVFAQEYVTDYDAYHAAIRCGYAASYAREMATTLMGETYVQQKIKELEVLPAGQDNPEQMKEYVVVGLRREAQYRGTGASPSARVAALSKISTIYGLDAPVKTRNEHTGPDGQPLGGVLVIPGLMTEEAWAAAAKAQQLALTTDPNKK